MGALITSRVNPNGSFDLSVRNVAYAAPRDSGIAATIRNSCAASGLTRNVRSPFSTARSWQSASPNAPSDVDDRCAGSLRPHIGSIARIATPSCRLLQCRWARTHRLAGARMLRCPGTFWQLAGNPSDRSGRINFPVDVRKTTCTR